MFTEIRCEICINHFVEIILTLSCAVVDINLLQINCSQNFLLKKFATPLTVTTQLIDVKLYNVLEIHCSCAQWFLDFSLKARWRG
jgi:hypothetical protein